MRTLIDGEPLGQMKGLCEALGIDIGVEKKKYSWGPASSVTKGALSDPAFSVSRCEYLRAGISS